MRACTVRGVALLTALLVLLAGCTSSAVTRPKQEVTAESYRKDTAKGFVVLSALWGRTWNCAQFANGQLWSFGFDRLPSETTADNATADVVLEGSASYGGGPATNYVLMLDPGEYALTTFAIRVASTTDAKIANWTVIRSRRFGATIREDAKGSNTTNRWSKSNILFWMSGTCSFDYFKPLTWDGTMYCRLRHWIGGSGLVE